MLRPMRKHRRAWTPPIPITLVAALVAAPFALSGCQKIKELTGKDEPAA